jgi:Uma2 family endonuclease
VVTHLNRVPTGVSPATFDVGVETTHSLDKWQFREPDLVVSQRIRGRWLEPSDVVLVIEVSKSSIRYDTGRKARDYGTWGVPSYWVVDIDSRETIVHTDPGVDGYGTIETIPATSPHPLPEADTEFRLANILPAAAG